MRYVGIPLVAAMLLAAGAARSQQIPHSVREAEAEGAAFARSAAPVVQPAAYRAGKFQGSVERRCVEAVPATVWPPSLRSGEMILRGYKNLDASDAGNKMLWMPLHDPGRRELSLSIRGIRLGHPSDTLRQTLPATRVARQVGHYDSFGFPSLVAFPAAGQWLVVADVGDDWDCFVLNVAQPGR